MTLTDRLNEVWERDHRVRSRLNRSQCLQPRSDVGPLLAAVQAVQNSVQRGEALEIMSEYDVDYSYHLVGGEGE